MIISSIYLEVMTKTKSQSVFDVTAATYDRDRMRLIPGHEQFYATALSLIPADADHILDLGAGTGLFTAMIRARLPHAHVHLIDNSELMLTQAQQRFAHDTAITFGLADYTTAEWGSQYDAIVSALSIHHLDDAAKQALLHRVFEHLKPGGVFVNAEQIAAATPELEAEAKQQWLAEVRSAGATEQQVADSLLRQQADRCATTADQLRWLREAGFVEVAAPFEQGRFAVLTGGKP